MTALQPIDSGILPATARAAIWLEGIAQRLGSCWAVRGVDLQIATGETVAVTGPNGSGKTTLLRLVSTALRPTRGAGHVLGHDLCRDADGVRAVTTFVGHSGGAYADLTPTENLTFMLRMVGQPVDRRVNEALAWAGLSPAANVRVRELSSGMRRRLVLAAASLRATPVLLMDEPYNSVDDRGALLIDELITAAASRGGVAIIVLHDRARSRVAFDRFIELRDGTVAADTPAGPRRGLVGLGWT